MCFKNVFDLCMISFCFLNIRFHLTKRINDSGFAIAFDIISTLAIGLITGLLGAGGGFLIIPALVLFVKLPMKTAIGTSLVIIAINSIFGFLFSLKQTPLDWKILLLFTALAIIGIYAGSLFAEKIPGKTLKKWFGWFVVIMGVYIIVKELILK